MKGVASILTKNAEGKKIWTLGNEETDKCLPFSMIQYLGILVSSCEKYFELYVLLIILLLFLENTYLLGGNFLTIEIGREKLMFFTNINLIKHISSFDIFRKLSQIIPKCKCDPYANAIYLAVYTLP